MRPIVNDQQINYVTPEGTIKKARVLTPIGDSAARLELSENNEAIAVYSAQGEPGTFHFPDESKAVKEAAAATPTPKKSAPESANGATGK